jgi:hypothetical protein
MRTTRGHVVNAHWQTLPVHSDGNLWTLTIRDWPLRVSDNTIALTTGSNHHVYEAGGSLTRVSGTGLLQGSAK